MRCSETTGMLPSMRFNRRVAILAVPAILALAGGALAVHAASTPPPAPASSENESGTENQAEDQAGQAGEVETANQAETETNQAGDRGQSGHNDSGDQADHQFEGQRVGRPREVQRDAGPANSTTNATIATVSAPSARAVAPQLFGACARLLTPITPTISS